MHRVGMSDAAVLLDAGPEDVAKTLRSLGYAADADRVLRAEAKRRRKAAKRVTVVRDTDGDRYRLLRRIGPGMFVGSRL